MEKELSFEEALAKLEKISEQMETENTGLEKSMKLYKEGVELSGYCADILRKAKQQVSELRETAEGVFEKKDFNLRDE